jgi:L-alanine-DL-glutamate epimerase-like enolase superfamily enzyme
MKIIRVSSAVVAANFDWTFVRIETDAGITGIGEAFFAPGLSAVIKELGNFITGQNPLSVKAILRKLLMASAASGSSGIIYHAISAIEMALWDILGQSADLPLWQLWGGAFRDSIRIYADCHGGDSLESLDPLLQPRNTRWNRENRSRWTPGTSRHVDESLATYTPEAYSQAALRMVDKGFSAIKFDLDIPNPYVRDEYNRSLSSRELDYMGKLVQAVREAIGSSIDIAFDCHWKFTPHDAVQLAKLLEPYRILWLEDPIPPDNIETLKWVTDRSPVPILSGENWYGSHGFRGAIQQQAITYIAPDLQKVGGFMVGLQIAEMSDMYYLLVAPHNISSPVGTMAAVHLCAAIPNFLVLEWHAADVPFWDDIICEAPLIQDGKILLPERPGLGVTLNEDAVRQYAKPGEPFFS